MDHNSFLVPPKSRSEIFGLAMATRRHLGIKDDEVPNLEAIIEHGLKKLSPSYEIQVVERSILGQAEGLTPFDQDSIMLRDDVYDSLCKGVPRARFTASHELGHYVMHKRLGLARNTQKSPTKSYENSEWQANNFAGFFLMTPTMAKLAGTPEAASLQYQISLEAARILFKHYGVLGFLTN